MITFWSQSLPLFETVRVGVILTQQQATSFTINDKDHD